ncbi:MAG: tetratricopeptide repeat protein [Prevotella sp.]|nr:tetratricopeptide repeat protein [Prevotella sp.]
MKKIVCILLVSLFVFPFCPCNAALLSHRNQVVKDGIRKMFESGLYAEIIEQYGNTPRISSAGELSYVAESCLRLNDLTNASGYADMAVRKDAKCAQAFYVKGLINSAGGNYAQGITDLQKAISLDPKQSDYYAELGDIYFAQDDYTKALVNYRKAVNLPDPSEKAFYMIGAVHASRDDVKQALDTFYVAKSKIEKDRELYVTVLNNIGKIEFDNRDYKNACEAYRELTEYFPDDYCSFEKLVECYNALGYYERADICKAKLYTAYRQGELRLTGITDMFCTGHFSAGDKDVSAYERFEESSCHTIVKYIFYVADKDGGIDSIVSFEYTPAGEDGKSGRFVPVMLKGADKYGFNLAYDGNPTYGALQSMVKDIVEGKVEQKSCF